MTQAIARRIRDTLRAALPRAVRVEVAPLDPTIPTFATSIRAGETEHRFVVGWTSAGWPADVERLCRLAPAMDAVAAPNISAGARTSLIDRGVGWIDEGGGANIVLASGLVLVRDSPKRKVPMPRAGWARSTVAVAEAILTGTDPRVDSIQDATGLSRGATAKALAQLELDGLLDRATARGPASARRVVGAGKLLDAYATSVAALADRTPVIRLHRLWSDPIQSLVSELAPTLTEERAAWAVTGQAASMLLAPHLSNLTIIDLYVDKSLFVDVERLTELLEARPVERGHRVEVRPLPGRITATAGPLVEGVRCAPPARVYADLLAKGGRDADAAQHLREVLDVGTSA